MFKFGASEKSWTVNSEMWRWSYCKVVTLIFLTLLVLGTYTIVSYANQRVRRSPKCYTNFRSCATILFYKHVHPASSKTSTSTSKTVHLTVSQNVTTLAGTFVLNWNRILSSLGRLNVFIRSKRPPKQPICTLIWPEIIVLALICSSELQVLDRIWRKKQSF
jgi:hypothetical protein